MDKEALLEAVNALVRSPDAAALYEQLVAAIPLAKRASIQLAGPAGVLNAMLDLAVRSDDTYKRVLDLVARKRDELGYEPLYRAAPDGFDKTEYMREFMDQKRERERRAAKIENMLRRPAERLRGRARLDFMQRQSATWKTQRDAALEAARQQHGRRLSKEFTRQILDQFWQKIDEQLDAAERQAAKLQLTPTSQRSASLAQLEAALREDPYQP